MTTVDRLALARLFLRVAETGSVSAAGRALGIPQPTATRQLRQLEEALGARLVHRTTRGLSLTEAGEAFRADARRLLDVWEEATERLGTGGSEPRGRLRVVASMAMGQTVLADLALRFLAAHPLVSLEWMLSDVPIDLAGRGADCLLRVGQVQDEGLVVRRLGAVRRVVVAAPSLLAARGGAELFGEPASLARLPFALLPGYDGRALALSRHGAAEEVAVPAVLVTDSPLVQHRAALAGAAAAVFPTWMIGDDLASGRLVQVCEGWAAPGFPIHLAWHAGRFRPARLAAFLAFMQREVPKIPGVETGPSTVRERRSV